jgi:hypothetical protein
VANPNVLQHANAQRGAGATNTIQKAFAGNVAAGDVVLLGVSVSASGVTTSSVTDDAGNTYTKLASKLSTIDSFPSELSVWSSKIATGGTLTVTAHLSGAAAFAGIEILDCVNTSERLDVSATADVTSANASTGATAAVAAANELAVCFWLDPASGVTNVSPGGGWTGLDAPAAGPTSATTENCFAEWKLGPAAGGTVTGAWVSDAISTPNNIVLVLVVLQLPSTGTAVGPGSIVLDGVTTQHPVGNAVWLDGTEGAGGGMVWLDGRGV